VTFALFYDYSVAVRYDGVIKVHPGGNSTQSPVEPGDLFSDRDIQPAQNG